MFGIRASITPNQGNQLQPREYCRNTVSYQGAPSSLNSMQPREELATSSSYTVISFIPCQTAGKPRLPPKPGSSEAHSLGDSNGEN